MAGTTNTPSTSTRTNGWEAPKLPPKGHGFYRVRVVLRGVGMLHLGSLDEPELIWSQEGLTTVQAKWLNEPTLADVPGYIDWTEVVAITWRWSGEAAK